MIITILAILGLAWGSFVNALVWRLHKQASSSKKNAKNYSILRGRSMCPNCKHTLAASDLIPLASWLALRGKCRYCKKPIPTQYPLVEAGLALVFVASYIFWPLALASAASIAVFALWLAMTIILMALAIYDFRWQLLPDRLVLPLAALALAQAIVAIVSANAPLTSLVNHLAALAIGGGLFLAIFLISNGRWIGGGDVKLGLVLGLIVATPAKAVLLLFLASLAGTLASLPLLVNKKLKRSSAIPFGPFLILATLLGVLFGQHIINWYLGLYSLGV